MMGTYANSPLETKINQFEAIITDLHKRYPNASLIGPTDKLWYANSAEILSVLPKIKRLIALFDKQNAPWLATIAATATPLIPHLAAVLKILETPLAIESPFTYELGYALHHFIQDIPSTVQTLAPFLNPGAIAFDFSGLHADIPAIKQPQTVDNQQPFTYLLDNDPEPVNFDVVLNEQLNILKNQLELMLVTYYQNHLSDNGPHTQHAEFNAVKAVLGLPDDVEGTLTDRIRHNKQALSTVQSAHPFVVHHLSSKITERTTHFTAQQEMLNLKKQACKRLINDQPFIGDIDRLSTELTNITTEQFLHEAQSRLIALSQTLDDFLATQAGDVQSYISDLLQPQRDTITTQQSKIKDRLHQLHLEESAKNDNADVIALLIERDANQSERLLQDKENRLKILMENRTPLEEGIKDLSQQISTIETDEKSKLQKLHDDMQQFEDQRQSAVNKLHNYLNDLGGSLTGSAQEIPPSLPQFECTQVMVERRIDAYDRALAGDKTFIMTQNDMDLIERLAVIKEFLTQQPTPEHVVQQLISHRVFTPKKSTAIDLLSRNKGKTPTFSEFLNSQFDSALSQLALASTWDLDTQTKLLNAVNERLIPLSLKTRKDPRSAYKNSEAKRTALLHNLSHAQHGLAQTALGLAHLETIDNTDLIYSLNLTKEIKIREALEQDVLITKIQQDISIINRALPVIKNAETMITLISEQFSEAELFAALQQFNDTDHKLKQYFSLVPDFYPKLPAIKGLSQQLETVLSRAITALEQELGAVNTDSLNQETLAQIQNHHILIATFMTQLKDSGITFTPLTDKFNQTTETLNKLASRVALVTTTTNELSQYVDARAKRFSTKDRFASADKIRREQFISELSPVLKAYGVSGTDEAKQALINKINAGKAQLPGVHLSSVLNRILVQVDTQAGAVSDAERTPAINGAIVHLIQKIDQLSTLNNHPRLSTTDKERVNQLITDLKNDLHNMPASQHEYAQFEQRFKNRLHSLDDVMAKDRPVIQPLIINLLAALFTLGVAVIGYMVYTKAHQGTVRFFGDSGKAEQKVNAIEQDIVRLGGSNLLAQ